jgi:hypothetical protein
VIQEFLWGLLHRWYYFLLAGLLEPIDLIGHILGMFSDKPITLPPRLFAVFLEIGFITAAIHTYHTLRVEKLASDQRYQRATRRKLELVFDNGEPFEQEQTISDRASARSTTYPMQTVGSIGV